MFKRILVLNCLYLLMAAAAAQAFTVTLNAAISGHDERQDAPSPCLQETAFLAGQDLPDTDLKVGGNAYGCDSEWAASFEFDLASLPLHETVVDAVLTVTKTGYADDAQGFFYLGAFYFPTTGTPIPVPRANLTPTTALDILYPPTTNTAMNFDVTAAVRDLVDGGTGRAGFLLAGVNSEAGYEDWISVGGAGSSQPPQLVITLTDVVADEASSWSRIKGLYR